MDSLRDLYQMGLASSSHTMGPHRAALQVLKRVQDLPVATFEVELYGSLAATGKGHLTDWIIRETLGHDRTTIHFKPEVTYDYHANGMKFVTYDQSGNMLDEYLIFSVGGGIIRKLDETREAKSPVYPHSKMRDILDYCKKHRIRILDYIYRYDKGIQPYLFEVWEVMQACIEEGLQRKDLLPGKLGLKRKAKTFYDHYVKTKDLRSLVYAASQSVAEQNASGARVVTAPTCGSSGVLPGILFSVQIIYGYSDEQIIDALAIGGLIGNLVKENASISGAEAGVRRKSACGMAAAIAF